MGLFDSLSSLLSGGPTFKATGGGPGYQGPVGGGFNWPLMALMLGQMGSAISPRGSWQQNLGGVASNWARSNIYANAAAKAQPNFNDYIKAILGGGVTPPGTPGPTSVAMNDKGELELKMTPAQASTQTPTQTQVSQISPESYMGVSNFPFSTALLG